VRVQRRRGEILLTLDGVERDLLTSLTTQYEDVVHDEDGDDPAHERLFPTAYREDREAAQEFERYTREGLVERKSANAGRIAAGVAAAADGRLALDAEAVGAWLPALTDLRLVIAERLGIRTDDDPVPDDQLGQVYHWLAELQERLVLALDR
jgi:predicted transcriptional regulator